MGKKKKRKDAERRGNLPLSIHDLNNVLSQIPASALTPRWPTTNPHVEVGEVDEFSVQAARQMLDRQGYFEKLWSVEQGRRVKDGFDQRDGFVVAVPTPAAEKQYHQRFGGDPEMQAIACVAVSAHSDIILTITLDVEDVKQLVNRLSEAVAHVEARKVDAHGQK